MRTVLPKEASQPPEIIILGATSLIAPWLVDRIMSAGYECLCLSRKKPDYTNKLSAEWKPIGAELKSISFQKKDLVVVSLLPIWVLADRITQIPHPRHIIAFSTTSLFGKSNSRNSKEQHIVRMIKRGERGLTEYCRKKGICWTILRPTLIYDGKTDGNVTRMAAFIKKWQALPIAAPANGLRQPVHADDLADAVVKAIDNPAAYNHAYNLGGGEILSYKEMCKRIFGRLGRKPRIIPVPLGIICFACRTIDWLTRGKGPNAAMFIRMNEHLVYDQAPAQKDLGYAPRPFYPDF